MKIIKIGKTTERAEQFLSMLKQSSGLKAEINEATVLVVDYSTDISIEEHQTIKETIEGTSILFMENTKNHQMPDNTLFGTDAKLCVLKSKDGGRRQHLLVMGGKEQPQLPPSVSRNNDLKTVEGKNDDSKKKKGTEKVRYEITASKHAGEQEIDLQNAVNWLTSSITLESSQDIQQINASLIQGSITIEKAKNYKSPMNDTSASLYYSYDVEVAAVVQPKRNKIVKVTSVASYVSITDGLTKNDKDDRGDGTYKGQMIFYPGNTYTFKKEDVSLPQGWRIIKIAPETPNSDNQYTRTTGWMIGAEGGGEIAKDPKVAVKLSAAYNASESYSQSFKDFTALNNSNSAYCEWNYLYTKVYRDWESIFSDWMADIENFPDLAKSTMYMKNEVVYETPASDNSRQIFCNYIGHETLYAHSHMDWKAVIHYGIDYKWASWNWDYFSINLGSVIFPSES